MKAFYIRSSALLLTVAIVGVPLTAQQALDAQQAVANAKADAPVAAPLPPGYVIGAEDVLSIVFWRDKEMSADVVVRPDGKISLPLLNDVEAAGRTPDQLRAQLIKAASKYLEEPTAAVVVKEIHSRKVFVSGQSWQARIVSAHW